MKKISLLILILLATLQFKCAITNNRVTRGKKLFNDPTLGLGITGKTCNTCHEMGEGISINFAEKKKYILMGLEIKTLPEVINSCIEITMRGEGIAPKGNEMTALISYIKYLKEKKAPQKKH